MGGVGRWNVVARLGAGGMGEVFLGQAPDGDLAAVKVVRDEYADDPTFRARFRREVEACSRVRGPRVAELVDADTEGPRPWLAVRYVEGPTLAGHVAAHGALTTRNVQALAIGLADALADIWAAGIVHRDLKPSNVILAQEGPVLIDFGIATATDATAITRTGVALGSAGWIAPEVMRGQPSSASTDVWGWAGVVCFAASGTRPHGDGPVEALVWRALHDQPNPGALACVPSGLRPVIEQALAVDSLGRPDPRQLADRVARESVARPAGEPVGRAERDAVVAQLWQPPERVLPTQRRGSAPRDDESGTAATRRVSESSDDSPATEQYPRRSERARDQPAHAHSRGRTRTSARRRRIGVASGIVIAIACAAIAAALTINELAADSSGPKRGGAGPSGADSPTEELAAVDRPAEADPVEAFCKQFIAYDRQFVEDDGLSDAEAIAAIRSLDAPSELADDFAVIDALIDAVSSGTAAEEEVTALQAAGANITTFVDDNC